MFTFSVDNFVVFSVGMGLLSEGEPLSWEETKKLADHVRRHGIIQFINQYHRLKDRSKDCLRWGDEVGISLICGRDYYQSGPD